MILDSRSPYTGQRITTIEAKMHRFILPEFNTHRKFCLDGDSMIYFINPKQQSEGKIRTNKIKLSELFVKWSLGARQRNNKPKNVVDTSRIKDDVYYSVKELVLLTDGNFYAGNLNNWIRSGRLIADKRFETPSQRHGKNYVLGKDLKYFLSLKETNTQPVRNRIAEMNIQQLNEKTLEYQTTHITDVIYSGEKECFEVVTKCGNIVCGSGDHLIHTEQGWKKIKELKIGVDKISGRNSEIKKSPNENFTKKDGVYVNWWNRKNKSRFLEEQKYKCHKCSCDISNNNSDIHHIVPRHENMDLVFEDSNIVCLCKGCHKEVHKQQNWKRGIGFKLTHRFETVEEIRSVGVKDTYDISVEGEFENFVANGIVVHNSRNSASSRAIPVSKQIEKVLNDPAMPLYWGANQAGMSAREELTPETILQCQEEWLKARDNAVETVRNLTKLNLHKQLTNRIIEPFMWHIVVFTTTEIDNFFSQRVHPDAQPEMQALAREIKRAYSESIPKLRTYHIPYIDFDYDIIDNEHDMSVLMKVGIARCARTSYLSHDGKIDVAKDLELFDKLNTAKPPHLSPFEHVAIADMTGGSFGNFDNWVSIRYFKETVEGWNI